MIPPDRLSRPYLISVGPDGMWIGRRQRPGLTPVYSVGSVTEAKHLIAVMCRRDHARRRFVAPDHASDPAALSDHLDWGHALVVWASLCECGAARIGKIPPAAGGRQYDV